MMQETKSGVEEFYSKAVHWLAHSPIRGPAGEIYSWLSDTNPGYTYPEIMGYYIRLFSSLYQKTGKSLFVERAFRTAENLYTLVSPRTGAVSRGETAYVFDSAMCLSGLIALSRVSQTQKYQKTIQSLTNFVYVSLAKSHVAFKDSSPLHDENIWSLSFGASTLKTCIALWESGDFLQNQKFKALSGKISADLAQKCFREGPFSINSSKPWVYTHAHCYATEALLYLQSKGHDFSHIISQSADWLSKNQNEDGSFYNWYAAPEKPREKQGDATAQAIRIWLLVDRQKYADQIQRGFSFLHALQTPEGGLLYSSSSSDVNSWVTIFSAQAAWWFLRGPDVEEIV